MKHTICCIDDRIPVAQYPQFFKETEIINEQVIRFLLVNNEEWEDSSVKSLFEFLLKNEAEWSVNAFTNPAFYDNYCKEVVYSPDIFVYDWDYGFAPASSDSEEYLYGILANSYSMVFIFSGADSFEEIEKIATNSLFSKFHDRLEIIRKDEPNSVEQIFAKVKEKEESNFSFKYGYSIIRNSNIAIKRILSEISQLSIKDFVISIGEEDNGKISVKNKDFVDVIVPRYRNALQNNVEFDKLIVEKQEEVDLDSVKRIWAYRMYDECPSDMVSMGDIVKHRNGGYFLILSSDCHMNQFWKKNGGYVSLVPLKRITSVEGKYLRDVMGMKNQHISSLTNSQISITILPAVPISQKELRDFLVLPKGVFSVKVENTNRNNRIPLSYEMFMNYSKVVSIVDPFKSPLIQFIMDNISGYGCPNYSPILENYLLKRITNKKQ